MIERIVLIKLKQDLSTDQVRRRVAAHSRDTLQKVPGVLEATVGIAADDKTRAHWDLRITVRFAELDQIPAYVAHPIHREYVDDYLRPQIDHLRAWNFEPAT